jgi:hypothetical protein
LRNSSGRRPADVLRPPLARPLRLCDRIAPLHRRVAAHVCNQCCADETNEPALAAPLAAAAPWSRRLPVTVACCSGVWDWEAQEDWRGTGAHREHQQV